jgi:predicted nucleic acid-binding protein
MPKPRVYVESTIPSAYYTSRTDTAMVARRDATHLWWEKAVCECELVSSPIVMNELERGTSMHVQIRLALIKGLPLFEVTPDVLETAETYIRRKLMPSSPSDDALHLALASHYSCDVLVTWNYRHLANKNKFELIRRINVQRGVLMPLITTPVDLLGGAYGRSGLAPGPSPRRG